MGGKVQSKIVKLINNGEGEVRWIRLQSAKLITLEFKLWI